MERSSGRLEYFRQHSTLSDWLQVANPAGRNLILTEDADRSARLETLHSIIGLPIIETSTFTGLDVLSRTPAFRRFVATAQGNWAVRVLQRNDDSIVTRNRNRPLKDLVSWIESEVSDVANCYCEFAPHIPNDWATIFVVDGSGIYAEMVRGSLKQLTQGVDGRSDFSTYSCDLGALDDAFARQSPRILRVAVGMIRVTNGRLRREARSRLGCEFVGGDLLAGYFEAIMGPSGSLYFIDYNASLGRQFTSWRHANIAQSGRKTDESALVKGTPASPGRARGVARVVPTIDSELVEILAGDIIVCVEPTPDMIPVLRIAGGLIADRGGVLSHASIVCRELGLPCIVGTHTATELIQDGSIIEMDADVGLVDLPR